MANSELEDDDFYAEATDRSMESRSIAKVSRKLYNEGYADGKVHEESKQMQFGFDSGFSYGMKLGKICGRIYAAFKLQNENISGFNEDLIKKLLFESIPETGLDDTTSLHELIQLCRILLPSVILELQHMIVDIPNLNTEAENT